MASRKRREEPDSGTVRLVGYCRVSTEEQAREGVSLDAQRDRLAAYATALDYELVCVESDEGISGKVSPAQRPGLAKALEMVRTGEVGGLLVMKLDRLSRSVRDTLEIVDEMRKQGWRLLSVGDQLDTETATGRFTVTILAALAQMEREQGGERTKFALDAIAREGRGRSRFTPYGWRAPDGGTENRKGDRSELVPHTDEQTALDRIIRQRGEGKGARKIAASLERQGPNPRSGKAWTPESVAAILRRLKRWDDAGVQATAG